MSNPRKRTLDPQPSEKAGLSEGLKISLLGGFLIRQGEQSFGRERFRLHKACDLIKLLALAPRHRIQRDELVEWLWPEGDMQGSANRLSQVLHSARQVLEAMQPPSTIRLEDEVLTLESDLPLQVDVEAFEAAAAQARQSQDPSLYQAALALYTGELLPEDRYAEWAVERRDALQQTYLDLLLELARVHERRGEYQSAISAYQHFLVIDSLLEEAHAGLMRCFAFSGQRTQALRQYQVLQETLNKELQVEPEPATTLLYESIRGGKLSQIVQSRYNPLPGSPTIQDQNWGRGKPLPSGTVTFLFTDIQGSTPLWEHASQEMVEALQVHNTALSEAIEANGGVIFKTVGDSVQAAFTTAPQALKAAIEGQRELQEAAWNELGPLQVRMGLHTGEAELDPGGDEYAVSHTKNRVARIMSAAHGGQILLSEETKDLVDHQLPDGVSLKDLGDQRMKGMVQFETIFQAIIPGLPSDFSPLATSVEHPHNLPTRFASYIGREAEIEAVCDSLQRTDIRLLTITGVGGTGKTSLAQQAGWKLLEHFKDGVFFVDLTTIQDQTLVITAVAQALSIHELPGRSLKDVLQDHLNRRKLLLIVDNFEHVLPAAQELVSLLQGAPQLKLLVTSREPLHVLPERQFVLSPLRLPDPHDSLVKLQKNEAMSLFVERARAIQLDFHLTSENGEDIAEICRQLDGLPLAIELIVPRLRLFTPHQLLQQVANRLRLLTGKVRDHPERHQTMRSAIAWSYNLLPEGEQRLFYRLSVFPGSFTLEAAAAVCGDDQMDVISDMESLLDKNLVNRLEHPKGPRFWLFETLREYALDQLKMSGEQAEIQRKHAEYYAQLSDTHTGQDYPLWDLERHNLRAAFNWDISNQNGELALIMGENFFAWERQVFEGRQLISKALALPNNQAKTSRRGWVLYSASALALFSRDFPAARQWLDELEVLNRELNDEWLPWWSKLLNLYYLAGLGDFEACIKLGLEYRGQGDNFAYAQASLHIAWSALQVHNYGLVKEMIQDAKDHYHQVGDPTRTMPYLIDCDSILGYTGLEEHQPDQAVDYFRQAFKLALELSVLPRVGAIYQGLGEAAKQSANFEEGVHWMSLAETIKKTTGLVSRVVLENIQERCQTELKSRLAPEEFKSIWDVGQVLTLEQAIAYGKERLLE